MGPDPFAGARDMAAKRVTPMNDVEHMMSSPTADIAEAVREGLDDIEAGRVRDFDADRIIAMGRKRLADRRRAD